jgi:hypothetical protein
MDFRKQLNKDIKSENIYSNITIFKDKSFDFLYKKTERISTAIYLVTNLMSVEEPIKWQLRKTALGLIDKVMTLSNATMSSRDISIRDISQKLFQLVSLYEIAFRSGFISEMNYRIVDGEMRKIATFLSEFDSQDRESRSNLFDETFFTENIDDVEREQIKKDISHRDRITGGIYKGHQEVYKRQETMMSDKVHVREEKRQPNKKPKAIKDTSSKSQDRNKRREDILNIIKQKGNVSVKDISNIIKDTSEKTIQRELISMVEDDVLLKEGERRWSRYMIKQ